MAATHVYASAVSELSSRNMVSQDIYDTLLKLAEDARMDCDKARLGFQEFQKRRTSK